MTNPAAKDITNLFLYGEVITPTNLVDDSLIRPVSSTSSVDGRAMSR